MNADNLAVSQHPTWHAIKNQDGLVCALSNGAVDLYVEPIIDIRTAHQPHMRREHYTVERINPPTVTAYVDKAASALRNKVLDLIAASHDLTVHELSDRLGELL